MAETSETDFTATEIAEKACINSIHFGDGTASRGRPPRKSPVELLQMGDLDLLETLDVIHNRKLTLAGLLLAGKRRLFASICRATAGLIAHAE
jgi:hypothetical protein